jgi:hypothetical protein
MIHWLPRQPPRGPRRPCFTVIARDLAACWFTVIARDLAACWFTVIASPERGEAIQGTLARHDRGAVSR